MAARRGQAPEDPLIELTGIRPGPSTVPDDAVLARLLPDFHREDPQLSAGLRSLREPELIAAKDTAAVVVLDTLPRGGGTVRLDQEQALAWMAALNDIRLAIGTRLDITDDGELPTAGEDPHGPATTMFAVYEWLSMALESLVEALMRDEAG